jgi:DNA polymerase-3 subunit gamma/tau
MTQDGAYRVLARKYRPQNFADLIGQEPMVRTLSNAFRTGRIAQAYMLTGVRGVGKTTTARILARALNYQTDEISEPTIDLAQEGIHCQQIMEGRHVDVIEMDAASHTGIDDIREIIESVQYAPALARYKVYIIDEVHMLSRSAFNGLLKTLEEPPAHLKFIFATTEIRKVPITVLSRCQRFDLRRIHGDVMVEHLRKIVSSEGANAEEDALALIARASEGSVRDALSILDQAIAHSGETVQATDVREMLGLADRARVIDLFENVMSGKVAEALVEMQQQYDIGADPYTVLTDLADFTHYVTRIKFATSDGPGAMLGEGSALSEIERKRGKAFADQLPVFTLGRAWQILLKGLHEVKDSERPLAAAEMVLVRLTHASNLPSHESLVKEIRDGTRQGAASPSASYGQSRPSGGSQAATGTTPREMATRAPSATGEPTALHPRSDNSPAANLTSADPRQSSGSGLSTNLADKPQPAPEAFIEINGFEDLIMLTEEKRDLKAKTYLRRHVRLIEFRKGHIEFNLAGDPPLEGLQDLKRKIEEWTGHRWDLVVSAKDGMPTLEEIERAEFEQRLEDARSHPAVAAILKNFEGARIVDVRIKEKTADTLPPAPDEEDSGLDDFFE